MNFQFNISDIIAILALFISGYSIIKTVGFNKKQKEFIETNDKLNRLLLEKENEETKAKKSADLSANFLNTGNNYVLKVFNRGQSAAKNVRIEIIEGSDIFIPHDIEDKFPVEILDRQQSVELYAPFDSATSSRKAKIKIIWDDEVGNDRENIVTPIA